MISYIVKHKVLTLNTNIYFIRVKSMPYPYANKLILPLDKYEVNGLGFGKDSTYGKIHWGIHLGEDIHCPSGTQVKAIGNGLVVYSEIHPGTPKKGNWGNIIIIAHKNPMTKKYFLSLYGHLENRLVLKGQLVEAGDSIGTVGQINTPENGFWPEEHLHFGIYTGQWKEEVLPGYWKREETRTNIKKWKKPSEFIKNYETQ
jgi:murein DD-endopeptidase MepM/ murein hydrolase activator NlpD